MKRPLDLAVAAVGLVIGAVPMAVIGLLVRWRLGRPVFFRQQRPGLDGSLFTLIKFRTMRGSVDDGSDADRLTSLGRFLRSTSLDELPELVNVVRGDMALVGPRPLLPDYLPLYTPEQAKRHQVRPGITGLAQVTGRNATTWEERLALDVWYVEHRSFVLDLKIIGRTLLHVLRRRGISQSGEATMSRFAGSSVEGTA